MTQLMQNIGWHMMDMDMVMLFFLYVQHSFSNRTTNSTVIICTDLFWTYVDLNHLEANQEVDNLCIMICIEIFVL